MAGMVGRGLRGLGSGLAATGVEAILTEVECRVRGRRAVYDTSNLARRLARRYLGLRLSPRSARRVGEAMRWSYGPNWGVILALAMGNRRRTRAWPLWGLGLGAAVLGFELVMLPATGATPSVSSWRRDELKLEVLNTMAFGIAAAGVLRVTPGSRRRQRSDRGGQDRQQQADDQVPHRDGE